MFCDCDLKRILCDPIVTFSCFSLCYIVGHVIFGVL